MASPPRKNIWVTGGISRAPPFPQSLEAPYGLHGPCKTPREEPDTHVAEAQAPSPSPSTASERHDVLGLWWEEKEGGWETRDPAMNQAQKGRLWHSPACRGQRAAHQSNNVFPEKMLWGHAGPCSATDETTARNSILAEQVDGQNHSSQTHFPRGQALTLCICQETSEQGSSRFSCKSPEPSEKKGLLSALSSCPHSISPSGADVASRLFSESTKADAQGSHLGKTSERHEGKLGLLPRALSKISPLPTRDPALRVVRQAWYNFCCLVGKRDPGPWLQPSKRAQSSASLCLHQHSPRP